MKFLFFKFVPILGCAWSRRKRINTVPFCSRMLDLLPRGFATDLNIHFRLLVRLQQIVKRSDPVINGSLISLSGSNPIWKFSSKTSDTYIHYTLYVYIVHLVVSP